MSCIFWRKTLQDAQFVIYSFKRFVILVFNATFSNISAISWQSVLVVEEAGVSGESHRPWASNW